MAAANCGQKEANEKVSLQRTKGQLSVVVKEEAAAGSVRFMPLVGQNAYVVEKTAHPHAERVTASMGGTVSHVFFLNPHTHLPSPRVENGAVQETGHAWEPKHFVNPYWCMSRTHDDAKATFERQFVVVRELVSLAFGIWPGQEPVEASVTGAEVVVPVLVNKAAVKKGTVCSVFLRPPPSKPQAEKKRTWRSK